MYQKVKEYITRKEIIEKILVIFLIIQPLLDFYFLYDESKFNFLGFSIPTIFRIVGMGVLGCLFLIVMNKNKELKYYVIYLILVVIYFVMHHYNALNFTSFYGGYDFGYSVVGELFYIIRMLMPLAMIIISSHYAFDDNKIRKIVSWLVFIICGFIVITNIFEISLGSYSKEIIKGNIFCWFTADKCDLNYLDLASKAFFNDPNRLSALLVLIAPLLFYSFIRKTNYKNAFLIILMFLGMFMLGTKVSTYGFLMILIFSLLGYLFFSLIKKELFYSFKVSAFLVILLVITIIILPNSPAINRNQVDNTLITDYNSNVDGTLSENETVMTDLNEAIKEEYLKENTDTSKSYREMLVNLSKEQQNELLFSFIEDNYEEYRINPQFIIDSYPYQMDPIFWYDILNLDLDKRLDFRYIEQAMLERIKDVNANKLDDFLGITFTRMGNVFDLERDFLSHYYTLGIIGLILLLVPYLIIVIVCGINILINYKNKINLKNYFLLMGIGIALFAAFYSGNVMDGLIVTLILGFVIGQLINSVFKKEEINTNVKFTLIMPTFNDSETIEESINSVLKQKYNNWELLIVDDGSTDNTKNVVQNKIKGIKNIRYFYQENQDQLRAISSVLDEITGDYILILHSDDVLYDEITLLKTSKILANNDYDAIIGDIITMDNNMNKTGVIRVLDYNKWQKNMALCLLWLGRNLFVDVAIYKRDVFIKKVAKNYLTWNTPNWLLLEDDCDMLNINKVNYSFIRYRVFEGNYINNEIGMLNVINGELRTATRLMKYFYVPFYKYQYILFRCFNKLKLTNIYYPIYFKKESKNKVEVIKFIINKRYGADYDKYKSLKALVGFYENYQKRSIVIKNIPENEFIYLGSDIRKFNKNLLNNNLSKLYDNFLDEMLVGFDEIKTTKKDYEKVVNITKFMCIYPFVKISIIKSGDNHE